MYKYDSAYFRINPLSLVEICGIVMEQIVDVNDQKSFIKKIETKVPSSTEAKSLCRIFAGHRILHVLKDEAEAKVCKTIVLSYNYNLNSSNFLLFRSHLDFHFRIPDVILPEQIVSLFTMSMKFLHL
jgi:hypothetical protein